MNCPACKKPNFIPDIVIRNAECYGSTISVVTCIHCKVKIRCVLRRAVICDSATVSPNTVDDWGG